MRRLAQGNNDHSATLRYYARSTEEVMTSSEALACAGGEQNGQKIEGESERNALRHRVLDRRANISSPCGSV